MSARVAPTATSARRASSSMGPTNRRSHSGSGTHPPSVTATTGLRAMEIARFRPCEIPPGATRRVHIGDAAKISAVSSLEPPSTTIHSSGDRLCRWTASIRAAALPASSRTVVIRETFIQLVNPGRQTTPVMVRFDPAPGARDARRDIAGRTQGVEHGRCHLGVVIGDREYPRRRAGRVHRRRHGWSQRAHREPPPRSA